MASNGRVGLRSGSPSYLVVGLSLVIIILLYSYWSASSRNSMLLRDQIFLQDRLRSLTSQKVAAERKKSSVMAQVADVEKRKKQLEGDIMTSSKKNSELNTKIKTLEDELSQERMKVSMLQSQESESANELQNLKKNIVETTEKLKKLTEKTNSFAEMYHNLKDALAKKSDELFKTQTEREICKVKLDKLKEQHPDSGGAADEKKKKLEIMKGRSSEAFKRGMARIKNQMRVTATTTASETTGVKLTLPKLDATQTAENATAPIKKTIGNVTPNSGKQTIATKVNNTAAATSVTSNGVASTANINTEKQPDSKGNTTEQTGSQEETNSEGTTDNTGTQPGSNDNSAKPTETKAEDESEDNTSENSDDKSENAQSENEDVHSKNRDKRNDKPVGARAMPLGKKYLKRIQNGQ